LNALTFTVTLLTVIVFERASETGRDLSSMTRDPNKAWMCLGIHLRSMSLKECKSTDLCGSGSHNIWRLQDGLPKSGLR
jgi:hypothetical protein